MDKTNKTNEINKNKADDMLMEMITPKVKEIEKNFSQGKDLTQYDINTLLLKSQYNHINEVTADVASLRGEFGDLRNEFNDLRGEFALLKKDIEVIIQKALNKNMTLLIVVMGAFLTLFKVIDKF